MSCIHSRIFIILFLISFLARGQQFYNLDSLLQLAQSTPDDTMKVQLYISIGQQYEGNTPDTALLYYEKALALSKKLGYTRGEISYYTNATYVYNFQGRADTGLLLNQRALDIARDFGDKEREATCLCNIAASYQYLEQYDSAMKHFIACGELFEKIGLTRKPALIYANLATMHNELGNYNKALECFEKAMIYAREPGNEVVLLTALNNGSSALINLERFDEAIKYLKEGEVLVRKINNNYALVSILSNLGDAYLKLLQFAKAEPVFIEGLTLAKNLDDMAGQMTTSRGLSYCYLNKRNYAKALEYVHFSDSLAFLNNNLHEIQTNALLIADISLASGDFDAYYTYSYKNDSLLKIIGNERMQKNIEDLEQKYKAQLREQQIDELEKEKAVQKLNYRTTLFIMASGIGIIFTVLVITYLLLRTSRQKRAILEKDRELQEFRISELEKEKQLLASEAVMKGQEEERKRLARDLHDGLGGMLSGIKFSFSHMKENLIMTPENQRGFERGMDMLDSSIRELRRVAHNLMPESLIKFGLNASLNDMCKEITASGALRITYQAFDLDKLQADQSVLIVIYRLVQELLNNVMKHAGATNTLVQLIYSERKISVTVEDDGKGMNINTLHLAQGIGWSNIKSRVEYLKGTWDIQSEPGKGTTVSIELVL